MWLVLPLARIGRRWRRQRWELLRLVHVHRLAVVSVEASMITQPNNATVVHRPKPRPKRRSPVKLILGGLGTLLLGIIAVVAAVVAYAFWGNPEFTDRPLVLIHSPLNLEQVSEGDGVLVHATARSQAGIRRVELWADDLLIAQRDADKDASPTSMVLSADWVPTIAGDHRLVVRAISAGDVDGQASILVESTENDEADPTGAHTVQEGETLDAIAQGNGTTVEDLTILNPGLDPAAPPAAGTEIIVPDSEPDSEPPSEGSQPIPTDSEPPPAAGEAPAPFSFLSFVGFRLFSQEPPTEPTQLRMELLSLHTPLPYEGLTCYIGMAGQTPRRYPDADRDPSTDESFARVKSLAKNGAGWNVAKHFSENQILTLSWPGNQPIPLDISCVGIGGGGTQALRLGRAELAIPPDDWDDTIRQTEVVGPEGSFTLGYRVGRTNVAPKPRPKGIDPDMTTPTNLWHIGEPTALLWWDYVPNEDEPSIDGFRVYLNGNLMWTIDKQRYPHYWGDAYFHAFPKQWMHPPCGEEYTVSVTAWRAEDDAESGISVPPITFESSAEDCAYRGYITFKTLETFTLDDDGRHEDRVGKIGPPYGWFYVNGQEVYYFDVDPPLPPGTGTIDIWAWDGLNDNSSYRLPIRGGLRNLSFQFLLDENDPITLGFRIKDRDTGQCDVPSDPGCDDTICEGFMEIDFFENPNPARQFDSTNGACRVTYDWLIEQAPLPGLAGYEGDTLPAPSLSITKFLVDGTSGAITIGILNDGITTWAGHPLEIGVTDAAGAIQEPFVIDSFSLAPADTLGVTYLPSGNPYNLCFTPDPNNKVQEIADDLPYSRVVCVEPPDLAIENVSTSPADQEILVGVSNVDNSRTPITNGNITVSLYLPDGTPLGISDSVTEIYSDDDPHYGHTFHLPLGSMTRSELSGGYRVQVEMWPFSEERDYSNNTYDVPRTERILVGLCNPEDMYRRSVISLEAYVDGRLWSQETISISPDELSQDAPYRYTGCKYPSTMFHLLGDMTLTVELLFMLNGAGLGGGGSWDANQIADMAGVIASESPEVMATCGDVAVPIHVESTTDGWQADLVICKLAAP
ncbi:MAG: LysM peptidoglycan-binding domain-containing protein [Anaerolineae bacterium]|nr:LysM peptidoglycan-binding domain-containing protein [Anaerolineae bacterium]